MKKQLIGFILSFLICVMMPLRATAEPAREFSLKSSSLSVWPGDTVKFTATLRLGGNPLAGETVRFSFTPDDGTASLSAASATTDSNGEAQTALTFGSSASGSYQFTASADNYLPVNVTVTVNSPSRWITVVSPRESPWTVRPGDTLTFNVGVWDRGTGVDGQTVRFSVAPDDETVSLSATTATTDNAYARTTLTFGSGASGSYSVTASADNYSSASMTVEVDASPPPPPRSFSVDISPKNPGPAQPGDAFTFTAEVEEDGNPVGGQLVGFRITPDDGTASLSTRISFTDSNGEAQTTLTLGSSASGSYSVTASAGNGSAGTTVEVDTSSSPPTPEVVSDDNQTEILDDETPSSLPSPPTPEVVSDDNQTEILDDETLLSIGSASVVEGDSRRAVLVFEVMLSAASTSEVTVSWVTVTGTATAGQDYKAGSGTLTFAPGETMHEVRVQVLDDALDEADETLTVRLRGVAGATLAQAVGTGTILDDDGMNDGEDDGEVVFGFAEEVEDQAYTAGTAIAALVLPAASGGTGALTYSISSLPAGLVFDAATRTIAGTPSAATDGAVDILYTVTDEADNTDSLIFSITVNPPLIEDFESLFDLFFALGAGKVVPTAFALADNFPNPFNPATTIQYALPYAADVELTVYNVVGQPVRTLVAEHQSVGHYAVEWDATDDSGHSLSSGMYFYRLQAGEGFHEVKKMLLLK